MVKTGYRNLTIPDKISKLIDKLINKENPKLKTRSQVAQRAIEEYFLRSKCVPKGEQTPMRKSKQH